MVSLDKTDLKILQVLQAEARITNQDLSERVNLSASSCLQRVRRLEQAGVLMSYHSRINLPLICRHIVCIATVSLKNHSQQDFREFEQLVKSTPEVVECYTVSGEFDFFLKIICPDMNQYLKVNDALVSSVNRSITINTHVVMNQNKYFEGLDLGKLTSE
ncbi:Lrp/AsnC family transcriptional regulator [Teredinibacter turnerae]|uniref:Lrp/AsnC family transcriptional regulator n=1 Tax=Teredinibacter turnerae TaxID=2426 RepID=UPI0003710A9B|nr:Lrp/AsnC family transcriptional regulator [Teredinibacter turnerae]